MRYFCLHSEGLAGLRLQHNGRPEQASGPQPERQPAGKDPVRRGQIRRSLPGAIQDQELMLQQKRLGNNGTGTARSEQASQGSDEMDEKDDQIARHRILAGREIPMNYGRNNNSPATPRSMKSDSSSRCANRLRNRPWYRQLYATL
jgi:hypothetical protein